MVVYYVDTAISKRFLILAALRRSSIQEHLYVANFEGILIKFLEGCESPTMRYARSLTK